MIISLYIYDICNLVKEPILTHNILEHTNRYNNIEKRRISESNYHMACIKLKELGANLDSFIFDNGKPLIDDYYISFSHNQSFYGFSISKENNGIDIEEIVSDDLKDKLAKKMLKENDYKLYNDSNNKNEFLTRIWCEIEAAGKMDGCGIDLHFNHPNYVYKSFKLNNNIITISAKEDFEIELYINDVRSNAIWLM